MNDFEKASRLASTCLVLVSEIGRYGQAGDIDSAYRQLQTLSKVRREWVKTVFQHNDQLAVISDRQFELRGSYWSSAHEAAIEITRIALEQLYYPAVSDIEWGEDNEATFDENAPWGLKRNQVDDPQEQRRRAASLLAEHSANFVFDHDWFESLQEGIRYERAKLLITIPQVTEAVVPQQPPRLVIDIKHGLAILDGTEHAIKSERALLFLQVLSQHPNEWISGPALGKGTFGDDYIGLSRPDKLRDYIPQEIFALIDSQTGAGYKFVPSRKQSVANP